MRVVRAWLIRLAGVLGGARADREFDAELDSHLQLHIDDNLRAGLTPAEARRRALAKLASVASVSEAHRDRRGLPRLESIVQDARYALRGMRRHPSFAAACIGTLALGIGANSAIFSVVNGVLFAPLPYHEPERLVSIWIRNSEIKREPSPLSAPDVTELRRMLKTADVEAMQANIIPAALIVGGEVVPAQGVLMTAGMFRMLGRAPILGRLFEANDGLDAIVISHAFWQRQFGGDPNVIGRSVGDGRRSLTIVGVMPPAFLFPYPSMLRAPVTFTASSDVDFWAELSNMVAADRAFLDRNTRLIAVVARLKDGVGLDAARADVEVAWRRLAQAYPDVNGGWEAEVVPLHEQAVGGVRTQLLLLLGSVAIVLIVACVNVANLLLGRSVARQRELALRSALGAGRGRLLQQAVIETVMLSMLGALAGIVIARWITPLLVAWAPAGTPRLAEVSTDWTVAMMLLAGFASLALLLATVGIYSVLAYTVRQRVREIGIRLGLGAPVKGLLGMIMIEGVKPTLVGVGFGLVLAAALVRVMETLLFGVSKYDPGTFSVVALLMLAVGVIATLVPAYRATRVDPIVTLRAE